MPEPIIHIDRSPVFNRVPKSQWDQTLDFFRNRESVLFLSYCRFWEKHPFVQQALAKILTAQGVQVTWVDSFGWRRYQPVVSEKNPLLDVRRGPQLPFSRFAWSRRLTTQRQLQSLAPYFERYKNPVVWVQGGIDEALAAALPHIDVFSTFDDPYRHSPNGILANKSKLILCQNSFTYRLYQKNPGLPLQLSLPPVAPLTTFTPANWTFPSNFPQKRMGYIGAFKAEDYDLEAFEHFVRTLPDHGFILAGRTDREGLRAIKKLQRYPNFVYIPWAPREKIASLWKQISVCLLLYRREQTQDGAFPTKIVEATSFGVPAVATAVPKTLDLAPYFPRSSSLGELVEQALQAARLPVQKLAEIHRYFALKTDPQRHLMQVAQTLSSPLNRHLAA